MTTLGGTLARRNDVRLRDVGGILFAATSLLGSWGLGSRRDGGDAGVEVAVLRRHTKALVAAVIIIYGWQGLAASLQYGCNVYIWAMGQLAITKEKNIARMGN